MSRCTSSRARLARAWVELLLAAAVLELFFALTAIAQRTTLIPGKDGFPCQCTALPPDTDPPEPDPPTWGGFAPIAQPAADFDLEVPAHEDPSGPVEYRWIVLIGGNIQGATTWGTSTTDTYDGFGDGVPYCFRPQTRDQAGNESQWGPELCEIALP